MTQFTAEQLTDALERTATKLQAFYDTLAEDERLVLDLALDQLIAGGATDTQQVTPTYRVSN